MESPIMLDKPAEFYKNVDKNGFPFDEEEGSDAAWNDLTNRHPDIAARIRNRPGWGNKRRPSNSNTNEFAGGFSNRFPFDDIPPEFREHFPSHWSQRFAPQQSQPQPPPATHNQYPHYEHQYSQPAPQQTHPQKCTIATQTSTDDLSNINQPEASSPQQQSNQPQQEHLQSQQQIPQHGLRNTVDLGQKTPVDPSVDADRNQRAMSAPPDNRPGQAEDHGNVRHIPIFVEGRDEPIINKNVDQSTNFGGEHRSPRYTPSPDREQYFDREVPSSFRPPQHFSRSYGTPFGKGVGQPFAQQKVFPQGNYRQERGRSQSPKSQNQQQPHPPQQQQPQQPHHPQQPPHPQQQNQQPPPQTEASSPKVPPTNDPITKILGIQKEVLDLMNEVENFVGHKKDKRYLYLDEMLTRNLIKLDDIDTEGKENIRQARREAIKCIQKCISVLEAKADSQSQNAQAPPVNENKETQPHSTSENLASMGPNSPADIEMANRSEKPAEGGTEKDENAGGDVKMETKEASAAKQTPESKETNVSPKLEGEAQDAAAEEDDKSKLSVKEKIQAINSQADEPKKETKKTTKKGGKKRDKSKETKNEKGDAANMQVEEKIETNQPNGQQPMEVDGNATAPSQ